MVNLPLIHQNLVMVNEFNSFLHFSKEVEQESNKSKFFIKLIDITTELCFTTVDIFYTYKRKNKIESEF